MPNSRIEASTFLTDDQIELLGAWTTNGNNLLAGGGDLLGSNDNFGWFFITNSIRRGGFFNSGEFFLSVNGSNPNHRAVFKPIRTSTLDAADFTAFTFALPDNVCYRFGARVQFRNTAGNGWGMFERIVGANREGGTSSITQETSPITEREGGPLVSGVNARWNLNASNVELILNGIAATQVNWSILIQYQGIES